MADKTKATGGIKVAIPPYRMGQIGQRVRVWDGNGRTMGEFPNGQQGWADARAIRESLTYYESYGEIMCEDMKITCLQNSLTAFIHAARMLTLNPTHNQYLRGLVDAKNDAIETLSQMGVKVEFELHQLAREDDKEQRP